MTEKSIEASDVIGLGSEVEKEEMKTDKNGSEEKKECGTMPKEKEDDARITRTTENFMLPPDPKEDIVIKKEDAVQISTVSVQFPLGSPAKSEDEENDAGQLTKLELPEDDQPEVRITKSGARRHAKYKVRTIPFLRQLKKMIEEVPSVIKWDNGNIIIPDPKQLEKTLPLYYKHNNYASFQRQLNNFGYHRKFAHFVVNNNGQLDTVYHKLGTPMSSNIEDLLSLRPVLERTSDKKRDEDAKCRQPRFHSDRNPNRGRGPYANQIINQQLQEEEQRSSAALAVGILPATTEDTSLHIQQQPLPPPPASLMYTTAVPPKAPNSEIITPTAASSQQSPTAQTTSTNNTNFIGNPAFSFAVLRPDRKQPLAWTEASKMPPQNHDQQRRQSPFTTTQPPGFPPPILSTGVRRPRTGSFIPSVSSSWSTAHNTFFQPPPPESPISPSHTHPLPAKSFFTTTTAPRPHLHHQWPAPLTKEQVMPRIAPAPEYISAARQLPPVAPSTKHKRERSDLEFQQEPRTSAKKAKPKKATTNGRAGKSDVVEAVGALLALGSD